MLSFFSIGHDASGYGHIIRLGSPGGKIDFRRLDSENIRQVFFGLIDDTLGFNPLGMQRRGIAVAIFTDISNEVNYLFIRSCGCSVIQIILFLQTRSSNMLVIYYTTEYKSSSLLEYTQMII